MEKQRESWEHSWREYDLILTPTMAPDIKAYFDFCRWIFRTYAPESSLEVGCGSGVTSLPYAMNGCEVMLLDISRYALKTAKRIYRAFGLDAEFVLGDAFKMPFRDGSFDLVHNAGVLEHFPPIKLVEIIEEMTRVSSLVISTIPYWRSIWYHLAKSYCRIFRKRWFWGGEIERSYKSCDLIREFKSAELEITFVKVFGYTACLEVLLKAILPNSTRVRLKKTHPRYRYQNLESFLKSIDDISSSTIARLICTLGRIMGSRTSLSIGGFSSRKELKFASSVCKAEQCKYTPRG